MGNRFAWKLRTLVAFGVCAGVWPMAHAGNGYIQQTLWAQTDVRKLIGLNNEGMSDGFRLEAELIHSYSAWTSAPMATHFYDETTINGYNPPRGCNLDGLPCPTDTQPVPYTQTYVNYDVRLYSHAVADRGSLHVAVTTPVIYSSAIWQDNPSWHGVIWDSDTDGQDLNGIASTSAGLYGSFSVIGSGADPVPITAQARVTALTSYVAPEDWGSMDVFFGIINQSEFYAGLDLFRTDDGGGWSYVTMSSDFGHYYVSGREMSVLSSSCEASYSASDCSYEILLSESMLVTPGETINLHMNMFAASRASGVAIDASHSAHLSFILPQGYALQGDDGFLADVPVTSVPEPSLWALLAGGLCTIGLTVRRQFRTGQVADQASRRREEMA